MTAVTGLVMDRLARVLVVAGAVRTLLDRTLRVLTRAMGVTGGQSPLRGLRSVTGLVVVVAGRVARERKGWAVLVAVVTVVPVGRLLRLARRTRARVAAARGAITEPLSARPVVLAL